MRQQLCNPTVLVRGQTGQHIFQIGIRVMPIEPGALDQAHACQRRLNIEPPCRSTIEPGRVAGF